MIRDDTPVTRKPADSAVLDVQLAAIELRDEIRALRVQSGYLKQMLLHPSPSADTGRLLSAAQHAAHTLDEIAERVEGRAERASIATRSAR